MDVTPVTATPGSGLTASKYQSDFGIFSGHQITRSDMASVFQPGADIAFDGFGASGLRHINGIVAFATAFGNGTDAAAIQQAVNFVASSPPGRGVVYITVLSGAARWAINAQITLYSGIQVIGLGYPILNKTVGSPIFNVSSCSQVTVQGLMVDGNASSGGLVYGTDCSDIMVRENIIGVPGDSAGTRFMGGPLLSATGVSGDCVDLRVVDNYLYEQNELAYLYDCHGIEVSRNVAYTTRGVTSSAHFIDLHGCVGGKIHDNWMKLWGEAPNTSSGPAGGIYVDAGGLNTISKNLQITNNFIWGGNGHGVYLNNTQFAQIQGNVIANVGMVIALNTYDGIHVQASAAGNSKGIVIRGNVSTNFPGNVIGSAGTGCRYGLNVDANTTDIEATDNFLEAIDDSPLNTTHFMCDTAGINFLATTRSFRRENRIILDQEIYVGLANLSTAQATAAVRGIRKKTADTPRHDQVIAVAVSSVYVEPAGAAVAVPMCQWMDNIVNTPADGHFAANDQILVRFTANPTLANHKAIVKVIS